MPGPLPSPHRPGRLNKRLTGIGAAAMVMVAAMAVLLIMRASSSAQATPDQGRFTLGASVPVAEKTIDTGGGTISVGANGGPISGMTLDVPQGSYENSRDFKVSYRPITGSTYKEATPLGPLISVNNGGGYANAPMTLTIPVKIPAGKKAVGVYYDEKTGAIEAMPLLAQAADSITVLTAHFTDISVMQIAASLTDAAISAINVDSGFRPGADDWEFPNAGSYLDQGNCNGMSVTAMWYYATQKLGKQAPQLNGLLDNNGKTPAPPNVWQDDSWGYRFASVVQDHVWALQRLFDVKAPNQWTSLAEQDDSATFSAIAFAINES
jgi:hypothetical protein